MKIIWFNLQKLKVTLKIPHTFSVILAYFPSTLFLIFLCKIWRRQERSMLNYIGWNFSNTACQLICKLPRAPLCVGGGRRGKVRPKGRRLNSSLLLMQRGMEMREWSLRVSSLPFLTWKDGKETSLPTTHARKHTYLSFSRLGEMWEWTLKIYRVIHTSEHTALPLIHLVLTFPQSVSFKASIQ